MAQNLATAYWGGLSHDLSLLQLQWRRFLGLQSCEDLMGWRGHFQGDSLTGCWQKRQSLSRGPLHKVLSCPHNTQPALPRSGDPRKRGRTKGASMPPVTYLQKWSSFRKIWLLTYSIRIRVSLSRAYTPGWKIKLCLLKRGVSKNVWTYFKTTSYGPDSMLST